MANIKKYNPETQSWETWSSNSATGVYSVNPLLTPEDEEVISVEDALVRDRDDIELMKKNISWLALHGGGGPGGGGGSSEGDITNTIEVYDINGNVTTNMVWRPTYSSISYRVFSSKASNKFNISISLDGRVIETQKGIDSNRQMSVKLGTLKKTTNNKHTLRIVALDLYDNMVSTNVELTELALSVSGTNANNIYTVDVNEVLSNGTLSVNCKSSIIGRYVLYWGTSSDIETNPLSRKGHQLVSIESAFDYQVTIPYWAESRENRLLENNLISIGQSLMFYFLLVKEDDPSVTSEVLELVSTVVSPDNLAIKPLSLSPEIREITKISKVGILNCNFIVYLNATSFQYNYRVNVYKLQLDPTTEEWVRGEAYPTVFNSGTGEYKKTTSIMYNNLHTDDFFEGGSRYEFVIYAEDRMNSSKNGQVSTYVEIQHASDTKIDLGPEVNNSKVFEFDVREHVANEDTWTWSSQNDHYFRGNNFETVTTTANLINMGGKSKREITNYRFTNKAHMIINQSNIGGEARPWFPSDTSSNDSGIVPASAPQCTLSIRYYNDYTPDDNRTIFNFGNYVPQTATSVPTGQGILINNHDFYVKLGTNSDLVTGKIQDGIYHAIDIVIGRNNQSTDGPVTVEVYHNGVLLAFGKNNKASDFYTLSRFNDMSVACNKRNDSKSQYTNIRLQSVAFYSKALDPYQIVCNYINSLITWELTENNELNSELLNEKLTKNLIFKDNEGHYNCPIWNYGEFDTYQWIEDAVGSGSLFPKQELWNVCPIPIIILDFSTISEWEWDVFTESWDDKNMPGVEVPIYYFNPYNTGTILNGEKVIVSVQGTTSKSYAIKNLNIDFGEDRMFWAKQSWFPERVYTLKADIVDSAHVNNACIGKFVNTCAQNTQLLEPTPPMRYFNANKESSEFSDLPLSALAEGGVTVKHTLEGFPVLLLARFLERGSISNRSLGIYSFNLGREAYHNMGFELLKRFRNVDQSIAGGDTTAPCLLGRPNTGQDVITFDAESWEGRDSFNCTPRTASTKTRIDEKTNGGFDTSVNAIAPVQLDGYFWSDYPGHINHYWSAKYPEGGSSTSRFKDLCTDLIQCPYVKGNFDTGDRGNVYRYDWDGTQMIVPDQTSGTLQLQRLNKQCPFSIKNAVFYYVVCMLFGLVDSLGKNLNMRIWNVQDPDSKWYPCFYDMDTAMGLDNIGTEKVAPDVCDESLSNNPELQRSFIVVDPNTLVDNRKAYTVKDNKLWGIIDHSIFKDQFVGNAVEGASSSYGSAWSVIRTNYLKSVDDFMNLYFSNQAEGIGELLYNQDYDTKYLTTPQYTFMYGDRKAFVRDWIAKRINFLDSYFGYLQREKGSVESYLESVNIQDCSYKNKIGIVHQSGEEYLPIVSSTPCILTSIIGNQANQYSYYLPANTPVPVRFANALGTPGIQTWINNSDLLLEIRNMSDLRVSKFVPMQTYSIPGLSGDELYTKQLGTLSSFTKFNLSGNTTFDNNGIDFIKLFKTWNNGDKTLPYSLTELNLSNTKSSNVTNFTLNLTSDIVGPNGEKFYQNPFENLTDINIRESCFNGVRLPQNIALNTLEIAGSAVEDVTLIGQSILKTVDFTGCVALTNITLDDCRAFETLIAENLPNLETIHIRKCPSLDEVRINLSGRTTPIEIFIDEVPNLRKLSIVNGSNPNSVISINASGLKELDLSYSQFNNVQVSSDCKQSLQSLNLSNSKIKLINWDNSFIGDYLDLQDCPALVAGGINITNNTVIEKVQLPNRRNDPVNLNFSFDGCTNLTRIYGNLNINKAEAFMNCKKFKIHDTMFNGVTVKNGSIQRRLADDWEYENNAIIAIKDEFQEGSQVTNLTINVNGSAASIFRNTAISAFDVYYVLRHLGPNVTSIASMFRDCPNIKMSVVSASVDNSPHWTMFEKCGNITNINNLFYGNTSMGPFRLYGNHEGESDEAWAHKGLFTPLVKCKNFDQVFGADSWGQAWFIADRSTFKLSEGVYFGGQSEAAITNFRPKDIYVNLNKMSNSEVYTAVNSGNVSGYERGNTVGFFDGFYRLPSTLTRVLQGLRYLHFGTNENLEESDKMIKLPIEVTSVSSSFTAESSAGYAILQRMFTKNENNEYNVTSISSSFNGSGGTWRISNNTLAGFTRLNTLGSSFSGLNKLVSGSEFPYDIFDPCCTRISNITSFFSGVRSDGYLSLMDLPGRLFERCTNLSDLTSCFSNFRIPFNLTPNGFINTRLSDVDYLFSDTTVCQNGMPNNFFNLGFTEMAPVTLTGATISKIPLEVPEGATADWVNTDYMVTYIDGDANNLQQNDTRHTIRYRNLLDEDGTIYCTPLSTCIEKIETFNGYMWEVTSDFGEYAPVKSYNDWQPDSVIVHKKTPRKLISHMNYVFLRSNVLSYKYIHTVDIDHTTDEGGDVEYNPDYCPFDYVYENNEWKKVARDNHELTFMWSFDGGWTEALKTADLSNFLLDDEPCANVKNSAGTGSEYFGCPPDLLRWCTVNPDLSYLFVQGKFTGRIPAYLLKPVPNITSIQAMFSNAGPITAYSVMLEPNKYHTIPPTFFTYTPNLRILNSAFSHLTLYTSPNVFEPLKKELEVEGIFFAVTWSGGTSANHFLISGVFATNRTIACRSAFSGNYEGTRKQYITFSNVFNRDPNKHPSSADYYVFYGYEQGYVTHESSPTCSTLAGRYNYSFYVPS